VINPVVIMNAEVEAGETNHDKLDDKGDTTAASGTQTQPYKYSQRRGERVAHI
jgi:hypothetical protein